MAANVMLFLRSVAVTSILHLLLVSSLSPVEALAVAVNQNNKHHVIVGTGGLEVQLITAKVALQLGHTCSIVGPSDSNYVTKCIRLMYGNDVANTYLDEKNADQNGNADKDEEREHEKYQLPQFASDGEKISQALVKADDIIIVCEEKGLDDKYIQTLLDSALPTKLNHVAVLSRHGGKLKSMEESIANKCQTFGIAYSILRAGNLIGGGSGRSLENGEKEWGLSKYFYDTKFDLSDAMSTMFLDKFMMGAKVTPGDPFKSPNFFSKIMSKNALEPRDGDTGRTAAAYALLAAVRSNGVNVSISTEKGERPPSFEEWEGLLES